MNPVNGLGLLVSIVQAINERDKRQQAPPAPPVRPVGNVPAIAGRSITPAPSPFRQPQVTTLPNVGVGTAPPNPFQGGRYSAPPTGGGGPETPAQLPPSLLDQLGGALAGKRDDFTSSAVGQPLGQAKDNALVNLNKVPQLAGVSNPLHLESNPADVFKLAFDTGSGKVRQELGNDAYKFVTGGFGQDGSFEHTVAENIPFKRSLFEWAQKNKGLVTDVYRNGFAARDGEEKYFGGRAVWEAFARENLTFDPAKGAGNIPAIAVGLATDPLNILGGPAGRTGKGLIEGGMALQEGGGALRKIGGAGMAALGAPLAAADYLATDLPMGAAGAILNPIKNQARKTRIGAQVGRFFEHSPRQLAESALQDILHWRKQDKAAHAASGARILDPTGITEGGGVTPADILPEGISSPDTPSFTPRDFTASERITTNGGYVVGLPKRRRGTTTRTVSDGLGNALATIKPMGSKADRWYNVTLVQDGAPSSRAAGRFDTFDEAVNAIDGLLRPAAVDNPAVIANPLEDVPTASGVLEDAAAVAESPRRALYGEAFSAANRSSRASAEERALARFQTLLNAAPDDEARQMITKVQDEMLADRNDIFSSMQSGRPSTNPLDGSSVFLGDDTKATDLRNLANRFEGWSREFAHEATARDILDYKGVGDVPFTNTQPKGSWAARLDTVAWNPDDDAATRALGELRAYRQKVAESVGEDAHAVFNIDEAIDLATSNRERFGDDVADLVDEADVPPLDIPEPDAADLAPPDPAPWRGALPEPDRAALERGIEAGGARANTFKVADQRLSITNAAMERLLTSGDDAAYDTAVLNYQDALQNTQRVIETAKREDDYLEEQFRNGAISSPDIMEVLQGGVERTRDTFAAADASFVIPAILPEQAEAGFAKTFTAGSRAGQTYGDAYREIEQGVRQDKNRLVLLEIAQEAGNRTGAALTSKEAAELKRLRTTYGTEGVKAASELNLEDQFRWKMRDALYEEFGYAGPGKWGSKFDTAGRIFSSVNLLAPWKFAQYYLGNLVGDNMQIFLTEGPSAVLAANDPRLVRDLTSYAFKGGIDPTVGALGDLARASGLGGFHGTLVSDNLAEAIYRNEAKAINRAAGPARFSVLGTIDKATQTLTDPFRNVSNGLEWSHRTGLWGWKFKQGLVNSKTTFATEMEAQAQKFGIDHADILQVLEGNLAVNGAQVAEAMSELAIKRGADMQAAQGFGTEMGRRWANNVYKQDELAREAVNTSLFSYKMTNADTALRRGIPYHFWASRAIPFYAEQALRHPGYAAAYYHAYQATQSLAEEQGWPGPLRSMAKLAGGPAGLMLTVNPLAMIGLLDYSFESNGGYTDENVSAVGKVLNQTGEYGFSLLPWWGAALNWAGLMGDSPVGLDPIGTYNARKFVGGMIQFGQAEGAFGGTPALMGKPFDQALQNIRAMVSGKLAGVIPGAEFIPPADANAGAAVQVRNTMLRNELAERGMTMSQYWQMATAAADDANSPEAIAIEDLHQSIVDDEMDGNVAYQMAVREVSRGNALMNALSGIVPGPKTVRQEDQLQVQTLANAYWDTQEGKAAVIPGVGPIPAYDPAVSIGGQGYSVSDLDNLTNAELATLDRRDVDFLTKWEARFGSEYRNGDIERMLKAGLRLNSLLTATPEAATLLEGSAGWYALGDERENALLDQYYAIANGEMDATIPSMDTSFTMEDLAEFDTDARYTIADAWLADHDPDGELAKLNEMRDIYSETHPEYGAYRTWQKETRKQWGTPTAFRTAAVKTNPAYAEFMDSETRKARSAGKSFSEIDAALDQAAFSLDGYMAYSGITKSRYAGVRDTGIPALPLASEGATGTGFGGESGGGGSSRSWGERVQQAILETQMARKASYDYLGVAIDQLPPDMQQAYMSDPNYPETAKLPSDAWIYQEYLTWAQQQQAAGGDPSMEAFIRATEQEYGTTDPTQATNQYFQPGVWPLQPSA